MNPNSFYNCQTELLLYTRERLWTALDKGAVERQTALQAGQLESYRETLRHRLLTTLGLEQANLADQKPVTIIPKGEIHDDGLVIEKLLLPGHAGQVMSALIYRRNDLLHCAPGILFLCGHDHKGKAAAEYQIACRILARAGFVVLVIDPPGQGERLAFPDGPPPGEDPRWFTPGTTEHTLLGLPSLFRGISSAGWFMSEALTALRYLADRPDVQSDRLAVTGNSGGGLQSALLAAICPNIHTVAPATFISSRRTIFDSGVPQDAEQCWPATQDRAWDHSDLLLLISPRPCLILAAEDDFFPLSGCQRTINESRAFWPESDVSGLDLYVDDGGHRYSAEMAARSATFFQTVFHESSETPEFVDPSTTFERRDTEYPLPNKKINCSLSGQLHRDFPQLPGWMEAEADIRRQLRGRRQTHTNLNPTRHWLRQQVFNQREETLNLQVVRQNVDELQLDGIGSVTVKSLLWESSEGLHNYGLLLQKTADYPVGSSPSVTASRLNSDKPLFYKLVQDPEAELAGIDSLTGIKQKLAENWQVLLHVPTAAGPIAPLPLGGRDPQGLFGSKNKLAMDLIAAGDSLAAIRVYDCWKLLNSISSQLKLAGSRQKMLVTAIDNFQIYIKLAMILGIPGDIADDLKRPSSLEDQLPPRKSSPDFLPEIILPGLLNRLDLDELPMETNETY